MRTCSFFGPALAALALGAPAARATDCTAAFQLPAVSTSQPAALFVTPQAVAVQSLAAPSVAIQTVTPVAVASTPAVVVQAQPVVVTRQRPLAVRVRSVVRCARPARFFARGVCR